MIFGGNYVIFNLNSSPSQLYIIYIQSKLAIVLVSLLSFILLTLVSFNPLQVCASPRHSSWWEQDRFLKSSYLGIYMYIYFKSRYPLNNVNSLIIFWFLIPILMSFISYFYYLVILFMVCINLVRCPDILCTRWLYFLLFQI